MSLSIVQKTTTPAHTGNGTSLTASFGSTVTAGNTVLVLAWGWCGQSFSSSSVTCTDSNSTSYTQDKFANLSSDAWCAVFRLSNVGSGITSVKVSNSAAAGDIIIVAAEVAGLTNSSPVDQSSSGTSSSGSTSPAPGSLTTANANDLLAAVMADDGTGTITDPSGWTDEYDETNGSSYEQGSGITKTVSATGSYNPTWTLGASAKWVSCQVAYKGSGTTSHLLCCLGCGG